MKTFQLQTTQTMTENQEEKCQEALIALYYLIIVADGVISPRELDIGNLMIRDESIDEQFFRNKMEELRVMDKESLYQYGIELIKDCPEERQIKAVAWMSNIANSDGFMDPKEWALIYKIYHKELGLDLEKIMSVQKKLPRP